MSAIGDFFKKIGHEIKTGVLAFGHIFVSIFGKQASADFVKAAEQILASDFGKVIMSIVSGLEGIAANQGGDAARALAFTQIKDAAVGAGLDLKSSLINLLIELAVNKAKGTLEQIGSAAQ